MSPSSVQIKVLLLSILFLFTVSLVNAQNEPVIPFKEQYQLAFPRTYGYQSVATVDDAGGIFLNPAAGGFNHGFNMAYQGFFRKSANVESQVGIVGFPLLNNIGYRYATDSSGDNSFDSWILGTAAGTEEVSFGTTIEFLTSSFGKSTSLTAYNAGIIVRPSSQFAVGYSFRNMFGGDLGDINFPTTHDFGIGIRPFGTNRLTITADGQLTSKQSLRNIGYKFGANVKIIPGLHIYGMYGKNERIGKSLYAGVSIALPTFSVWGGAQHQLEGSVENGFYGALLNVKEKASFMKSTQQIAEMKLKGVYNDFTTPGSSLLGMKLSETNRGVLSLIEEIDAIAREDAVDAFVLNLESFSSANNIIGMSAAIEEIGNALQRCRDKGKKIVAYIAPTGSLGSSIAELYLASYANTIFMSEYSLINQYGISYNVVKFRNALRKLLKIDFHTYTAGKYKSALNEFSDTLSEHKIEELNSIVDVMYNRMLERLSTGRKINAAALSDTISGILFPEQAKALGIIDSIGWYDDAKRFAYQSVHGDTLGSEAKVKTVKLYGRKFWNEEWGVGDRIAVIGVYGPITTGESNPGGMPIPFLGGGTSTGSETIRRLVEKAESDSDVKGIVIRIDSPGGSAVGSDEMYRVFEKVKKPLVVSMGDLAASGGYYVASFGKKIFASPTTLTASIGVIGQIPFLNELVDEYDVYVRSFTRGKYSGALNVARPPTPEFEEGMHRALDYTYKKFLNRIHQGRNISMDTLNVITQGRIYTGEQAKQLRLIDEYGGLYEAVQYIIKTNNLDEDIKIDFYPIQAPDISSALFETSLFGRVKRLFDIFMSEPKIELR